jgi:AcrR family transcriptional regulator
MPRTEAAFQQIRDERRQAILDKAAEVFAAKGLASVKISDLAKAAGISQGLLYRYFTSKEDVFIALLEKPVTGAIQWTQAAKDYDGSPLNQLRRLTEQFLKGMSEEPLYFQILTQAMALSGRAFENLMKLQTVVNVLRELIIKGQKNGEIVKGDPDQQIFLYLGCLYGLAAGRSLSLNWIDEHFPAAEAVLRVFKP